MKQLLLIAPIMLAFGTVAATADDDVPDPSNCLTTLDSVQRLYLCPDGRQGDCPESTFEVIVRGADNRPHSYAVVEIIIWGQSTGHVVLCAEQEMVRQADVAGWAMCNIAGGGCYKLPGVCTIRANGIDIRELDVIVSSDYAGFDNEGIFYRADWDVDPADLSAFVRAYQGGTGTQSCHDYNNDGMTGPEDLVTFVAAYMGGANYCSPDD